MAKGSWLASWGGGLLFPAPQRACYVSGGLTSGCELLLRLSDPGGWGDYINEATEGIGARSRRELVRSRAHRCSLMRLISGHVLTKPGSHDREEGRGGPPLGTRGCCYRPRLPLLMITLMAIAGGQASRLSPTVSDQAGWNVQPEVMGERRPCPPARTGPRSAAPMLNTC